VELLSVSSGSGGSICPLMISRGFEVSKILLSICEDPLLHPKKSSVKVSKKLLSVVCRFIVLFHFILLKKL
jgi:hypothetical protein